MAKIKVINYDSNGKKIKPENITIRIPLVYELIKKYYKKE